MEVGCLGVCPKGAVTVIDSDRPGEWRLVRPGEDLDALAEALGLGRRADAPGPGAGTGES